MSVLLAALQEYFNAREAFDDESEDHDARRWREAGDRVECAREAVLAATPK